MVILNVFNNFCSHQIEATPFLGAENDMFTIRFPVFLVFSIFLAACVTINVYFPAAAAEKAADQIIDNVWGPEQTPPDKKSGSSPPKTEDKQIEPKTEPEASVLRQILSFWSELVISPVHAGVNLDISTPAIQALQERMANRHQNLKHFYNNGAVGLTNNALITLRSQTNVPLKQRAKVKRWVEEENKDRLNLYYQIAIANGHPEWKKKIRATFAERWIDRAQKGWWYQDEKERWQQK